jgi:hypothetical protein
MNGIEASSIRRAWSAFIDRPLLMLIASLGWNRGFMAITWCF